MKHLLLLAILVGGLPGPHISAGESSVTYTVQVLSGLATDTPKFERVYCHDHFAMSGEPTAFPLICAPNVPPTNSKEKLNDHNLLSASGLKVEAKRAEGTVFILLDARNINIPKSIGHSEEELLRMGLECIRLTAHLHGVEKYTVKIEGPDRLAGTARSLSETFKHHSKIVPFVPHSSL